MTACSSETEKRIPQNTANVESVLEQTLRYSDPDSIWSRLNRVSFTKETQLFDSLGNQESIKEERVTIEKNPLRIAISWVEDDNVHSLDHTAGNTMYYLNGQPVESNRWSLVEKAMAAYYVFAKPYELYESGSTITYEGSEIYADSVLTDVLKVEYEDSKDIWWYFFDKKTGKYLASKVFHTPNYAFIVNTEFDDSLPLKFFKYRTTYRVDEEGKKQFVRAIYRYFDYELDY
jgi:hypothetical protein